MELVLILAALAALAVSGVTVAAMAARARRPPLSMPHEPDIDDEDPIAGFEPPRPSPIDRSGAVLDLEPIEPARPPRRTLPHRSGEGA